jgi:hypothetical protein
MRTACGPCEICFLCVNVEDIIAFHVAQQSKIDGQQNLWTVPERGHVHLLSVRHGVLKR